MPKPVKLFQVRGELAERVIVSTMLDPWFSLKALSAYSGLSVRTLRSHLADVAHPLPFYQVGGAGKILVRRSDYDQWAAQWRRVGIPIEERVKRHLARERERERRKIPEQAA